MRMTVRDYDDAGELRAHITARGFDPRAKARLFQSVPGRSKLLWGGAMAPGKVWEAVKRRCRSAGMPCPICNHSFRTTAFMSADANRARLEEIQELAGHADVRTTRLYVRRHRKLAQAAVERVQL